MDCFFVVARSVFVILSFLFPFKQVVIVPLFPLVFLGRLFVPPVSNVSNDLHISPLFSPCVR